MFSSHPALPALLLHGPLSRRSPARGCPVPALRGWEVSGAHGRYKKFPWSGTSGGLPFCIRREDHAGHRRANSRSCAGEALPLPDPPPPTKTSGEEKTTPPPQKKKRRGREAPGGGGGETHRFFFFFFLRPRAPSLGGEKGGLAQLRE